LFEDLSVEEKISLVKNGKYLDILIDNTDKYVRVKVTTHGYMLDTSINGQDG
jgi:hypothetical protein